MSKSVKSILEIVSISVSYFITEKLSVTNFKRGQNLKYKHSKRQKDFTVKKRLLSALALLAMTTNFNAIAKSDWSLGVMHNNQKYGELNDFESVGLLLNYQVSEYFSVEARLAKGTEGYNFYSPFRADGISGDIDWQRGVFVKASYPIYDLLDIYAIAGYSSTKVDYGSLGVTLDENNEVIEFFPRDVTSTENGFSYGAGLSYEINESFSMFVEYQALPNVGSRNSGFRSLDWKSVNVGVTYRF